MLDWQNCVLNDCLILEWDSVFLRAFHDSYHNLAWIILAIIEQSRFNLRFERMS